MLQCRRVLDEPGLVGDDGHSAGGGVRHRRQDGRAVLGEDHEDVGALGDEVLDVARLRSAEDSASLEM